MGIFQTVTPLSFGLLAALCLALAYIYRHRTGARGDQDTIGHSIDGDILLKSALNNTSSVIYIKDCQGRYLFINQQFQSLFNVSAEHTIGKTDLDLFPVDMAHDFRANDTKVTQQNEIVEFEDVAPHTDGPHTYLSVKYPLKDSFGRTTGVCSISTDITDRKVMELELSRSHEELEQRVKERTRDLVKEISERRLAEKIAAKANLAKSDLLANVSHELRTPLNAIIGFSEALKLEVFGPIENEKQAEYIDNIHTSGQHLLDLINDILDVSAIEAGKLNLSESRVDLNAVLGAAVSLMESRAKRGKVKIEASTTSGLPNIYADERRIKQIFLNLLSNAVKFTPEDGNVIVRADITENHSITIEVKDTGVGMDKVELTTALSQFGQADSGLNKKNEGTGLGLPLTKGLVQLHGGTFEIKSEKGQGTLVMLTFPKERTLSSAA